ncbi:MAG: TolC family protein [Gemmatimonadaceae bacterium]|nr:TolC family protein [Gemmatimonadaceae bacterium]
MTRSIVRLSRSLILLLALPTLALAQARSAATPLTLTDALRLAQTGAEALRIAEAGVLRAEGQQAQARSQYLPQMNGSFAYQRAIQNQFQAITKRLSSNEPDTGSSGGGGDFTDSPIARIFAAPNTAIIGVTFSQNLFTAGRLAASKALAEAGRRGADLTLSGARAQIVVDVAQAYYDAVASDRIVQIAESTLAQTERALAQVSLQKSVGSLAEFDQLRAAVARDNTVPVVLQARTTRELAYLRLKQLLSLPGNTELALTTPLRDTVSAAEAQAMSLATVLSSRTRLVGDSVIDTRPDTTLGMRAPVRQAQAAVEASEAALRAARWERLPSLQLTSNYQRFGYPPEGTFLPNSMGLFFPNWNVTFGMSFPLFTGGRIGGDRRVAQANLIEAQQRLQQTRELADLDLRSTLAQYEQALAGYAAVAGAAEQAHRAYAIAEVRYAERISTALELAESRTQLQQARLNRVNAAKTLEVARLRLALIRDLPLAAPNIGGRD